MFGITSERLRNFFLKAENQPPRLANRIEGEEHHEQQFAAAVKHAEGQGNVGIVVAYLRSINDLERREAMQLFEIFVDLRLITLKHLKSIERVQFEIKSDRSLKKEDERLYTENLTSYAHLIKHSIERIFESVTSMESINLSLSSHILDIASQTRELKNDAVMMRKEEKRTKRDEGSLQKAARAHLQKHYGPLIREYGDDLKKEFTTMLALSTKAIQLLNKTKQRAAAHQLHLKELVTRAGFPKDIAQPLEADFENTRQFVHVKLQQEIARERIELSAAHQVA